MTELQKKHLVLDFAMFVAEKGLLLKDYKNNVVDLADVYNEYFKNKEQ